MAVDELYEGKFKDEKAEVGYWEKEYKTCDSMRKSYEEVWYLALAFYFSKQWVVWNRSINGVATTLVSPPTPRNRVRLISNRIKPIIRDELTRLIKEEPQFYVQPNTTDPKDVAAARVGESIAEFILKTKKYNRIRRQATFWDLICGTSFIKTTCPGVNEDLLIERITAFHLFVKNLDDEDIQTQPYVIHARGLAKNAVEEFFGVELDADLKVNGASLEQKFMSALGIKNISGDSDLVYVKEIWCKPCKYYPQGAMLVIAGEKIIYRYKPNQEPELDETGAETGVLVGGSDGWPYDHADYPFSKMEHTASGRFYGTSTIEDIIPLQKEYNKTRSQIIESKNRMAKPQMTYTKGSIDVTKITSEVGLYIPVNVGFDAPKPIAIEPLPQYVLEELDRIIIDMDEIAGRNEISRGKVPTGIEAASAIAYLSEQNDTKIYNTVVSIEECTESVGKQVLSLVQQFWDEQKIISVVSKNNTYESMVFKMVGLNNNIDLRIEAGSMAPKSTAAKQAFITDLMAKGLMPPEKGFRYLQMSETSRFYEEIQVDAYQAQRENFRMSQGDQTVTVNDWDNDMTHIYEHELHMKSQEFEAYSPEIKQVFINHLTATKQKVVQNSVGNTEPGSDTGLPPEQGTGVPGA